MPIIKVNHVSETDHQLVSDAVAAAERTTSGEIVTVLARQSHDYDDISLIWSSALSFLMMTLIWLIPDPFLGLYDTLTGGWGHQPTTNGWVGIVIAIGCLTWLIAWLAMLWRPLRLFMTPRSVRARRVRHKAVNLFRVGAEAKTVGRTGVLLYVSLGEHRADIVADDTIARQVSPAVWGDAMSSLIEKVRDGQPGAGIAEAVRQIGIVLTEHFPEGDENPNELPDRLIEI